METEVIMQIGDKNLNIRDSVSDMETNYTSDMEISSPSDLDTASQSGTDTSLNVNNNNVLSASQTMNQSQEEDNALVPQCNGLALPDNALVPQCNDVALPDNAPVPQCNGLTLPDNALVPQCNALVLPDNRDVVDLLQISQSNDVSPTGKEVANRVKTGDVEKEKLVEERVKQLGLWNNKRILERCLYQHLSQTIDQDGLFQAINKCKRRRPLRERVESTSSEIVNTIQPKLVKDDFGNNVSYKVAVIMGLFTHNVRHRVADHTVTIQGSTPENRHSKLHKEVTIEFPKNVDISQLQVGFNAGVFKCEAPFRMKNLNRLSKSFESVSSVLSEETESVTSSDLKSIEGLP